MALWKAIKEGCWGRVAELNQQRINKWKGIVPDPEDGIIV
jgi:hypothetical protein